MDEAERLSALSSFFACSAAEAKRLDDAMRFVVYRHNQALIHQGDLGAKVWIVLEGQAQLKVIGSDGQVQLLMAHGPGELFGALPNERVFVSDVIARDDIAVLEISSKDLGALVQEETRIGSGLAMILARQYHAALDRMAARITLSATGRVCAELLNAAGSGDCISPPPVVAALGLMAQTTRETASRTVNGLERRGIVQREADKLTIVSRRMLEELIV
ncbi:Crp/Fnr family transcriptional regulator [Qipengyuania sp. YG27]|uniref:Crp/Fnr family transcriptional regulator n=1 Tax=Qipengyuania mesophila TaxID=2867246 RepID=A0ABS7JSQ0_9SPHN|nr:Crp/Fnr family transcriptional regulator [Qipengyuania mesophila]MBX7500641.1 Crp/Fnr family transcriptional regulator [Qipengyuania mesophila]